MQGQRRRAALAVATALALLFPVMPAGAETMGEWQVEAGATACSATIGQSGAGMILLTSKNGAAGILIKPADQGVIDAGTSYKLQVAFNGTADRDLTASAIRFGGAKVLLLDIPATKIAAGEADGFAFRVKLNGVVLFDKDMRGGARDAFASYVACSRKFGA